MAGGQRGRDGDEQKVFPEHGKQATGGRGTFKRNSCWKRNNPLQTFANCGKTKSRPA
jgi:hypothetical protein